MRYVVFLAAALLISSTAMANQCPHLIRKVDAQMANAQLDSGSLSEIRALRNEGAGLHRAGSHNEAVVVLNQALTVLRESSDSPLY